MQIGEGFAGDGAERRARQHGARLEGRTGRHRVGDRARDAARSGTRRSSWSREPNVPGEAVHAVREQGGDRRRDERHARAHVGRRAGRRRRGRDRRGAQGRGAREADADALLLIAAVWVNPEADDEDAVYANNEAATLAALAAGRDGAPTVADVLAAGAPQNPFFRS